MTENTGIVPYDLHPPPMLYPGPHKRPGYSAREVKIGDGVDMATLMIATWDACPPGCTAPAASHDAGRDLRLRVPCDAMPHCGSCECGTGHELTITAPQALELVVALT
jgi:hypothetical protein